MIKNVAGYDIAKLLAGSFGTLGVILSVNVRLHPLPTADRDRRSAPPPTRRALRGGRAMLAAAPLELEALDVALARRPRRLLARAGSPGRAATRRARPPAR